MRFGKLRMFFILNGIIAIILFVHLGRWLFSETTTGNIILPLSPNTITATYYVDGHVYTGTFLRNEIPYAATAVKIRYLHRDPSTSRIDSFYGIYAESLGWWLVLLISFSIILLTNNMIFSKGTVFEIHKRFPWISMEEYFPVRIIRRRKYRDTNEQPPVQKAGFNRKLLE
jgi:hypothetical protein